MALVKFETDDHLVEQIKKFTGEAVASKAFLSAANRALVLEAELKKLDKKHNQLFAAYEQQLAKIEGARDAAKLLLERVSQKGLFHD